ncbi:T9SS type A sorting domain-containing protein [Labilibacter sediminis]|nr:T9SS type A sorting domain-containing protein [Labilibacter sediminis]
MVFVIFELILIISVIFKLIMMKKILLLFTLMAICSGMFAQVTIYSEDFENGYTDGQDITGFDYWQTWGNEYTFTATNEAGVGAENSNWYVKMQRGTLDFAVAQRVYELTAGETYEYKIWIKPDAAGQIGSLKLEVIDVVAGTAVVAGPIKGTGGEWQELTVSYTAATTQNYGFRLTKVWGNQGASFDNVSLTCTTCTPTDIDSNTLQDVISIYPNPTSDVINIYSDAEIEGVVLISVTGKQVYQSVTTEPINVSDLPQGVYVLQVKTIDGTVSSQKVMIK